MQLMGKSLDIEESRAAFLSLRKLLRASIILTIVLIAGYTLAPLIVLLPEVSIPFFGLQTSTILFLVIAATFVYSLIDFFKAFLNFLRLNPSLILRFLNLKPKNPNAVSHFLLNIAGLAVILVAYWLLSPALYLIPVFGPHVAASIQLAIAAVVAIFFWSFGGMVYRALDQALSKRIETHGVGGEALLKVKVLKSFVYLLMTAVVLIIAYALFPSISLGADILIPNTNLNLGTLYWVVALAAIVLFVFSLIRNLLYLFRIDQEVLSRIIPVLDVRRMSYLKKAALNFFIVVAIVIFFFIISPYLSTIPNIGGYLGAAGQVVVGAIVVLFFWDIGRLIYVELESMLRRLEGT
ncbi:MAG: hypothetical protein QXN08_07285 [Nitrososphaerales archaeon]